MTGGEKRHLVSMKQGGKKRINEDRKEFYFGLAS